MHLKPPAAAGGFFFVDRRPHPPFREASMVRVAELGDISGLHRTLASFHVRRHAHR